MVGITILCTCFYCCLMVLHRTLFIRTSHSVLFITLHLPDRQSLPASVSGVCVHKNILVEKYEFECASVFLTVSLGVSTRHVYTVCLCMCVYSGVYKSVLVR